MEKVINYANYRKDGSMTFNVKINNHINVGFNKGQVIDQIKSGDTYTFQGKNVEIYPQDDPEFLRIEGSNIEGDSYFGVEDEE